MREIDDLIDVGEGLSIGTTRYPNGGVYGTLPPGFVTLLLVHRGAAAVEYDDETLTLVGGECGVIANEGFARFIYQKHLMTEVSWCELRRPHLDTVTDSTIAELPVKLPISQRMSALLKLGLETGTDPSKRHGALRDALGRAMFATYRFEGPRIENARQVSRGLLRARAHIRRRFSEDLSVERLAGIALLTPNHFVSAFGREFGITPIRYLWKQRATNAVRLLMSSGHPVAEIAYSCGYKSPYHFSRHIRSLYHLSPTDIRNQRGYKGPSDMLEQVSNSRTP